MGRTVVCLVQNPASASNLVYQLKSGGFHSHDLSVLMSDMGATRELAVGNSARTPDSAARSTDMGSLLGGSLGWLAGIGMLSIPGLGPFITAGPIRAALSGAAVGAAVGGIAGTLIGLGFREYEASRYEAKIKEGGVLVSAHSESSEGLKRAKDTFKAAGAEGISSSDETSVASPGGGVRSLHDRPLMTFGDRPTDDRPRSV